MLLEVVTLVPGVAVAAHSVRGAAGTRLGRAAATAAFFFDSVKGDALGSMTFLISFSSVNLSISDRLVNVLMSF